MASKKLSCGNNMNIQNPKISILTAVYNSADYLSRCVESVLSQDFSDWEMILVDDGSPDNSGLICDGFAQKDHRIKVVHKENGGLPSARLAGFEHSRGEYLVFLDADDWLQEGALTILYNSIISNGGYDVVRGCNRRVYENDDYTIERGRFHKGEIIGKDSYLSKVIVAELSTYLWGAIYRRELFSKQIFMSVLPLSVGEDWVTNIGVGKNVTKMLCIEDVVYCYYINSESIMQQRVCSYEYAERIKCILSQMIAGESDRIKDLVLANRTMALIKCFFIPELPFSHRYYVVIRQILLNKDIHEMVNRMLEYKFRIFIKWKFLFRCYSRIYCYCFKFIKLKGRVRRILT